ncbi:MAG: biotin synthase BioB [Gammaproteobacteria bacterium]|nr:biotin synthase BioB [Gammaproteobacteria bacterium]
MSRQNPVLRHDWSRPEIAALFDQPLNDLLFLAHGIHRAQFDPNEVQLSSLLSIKTGRCPEDCSYCPQSVHHDAAVAEEPLLDLAQVVSEAAAAKAAGATRFCMGAAWRRPKQKDLNQVIEMVKEVKALGMETCLTLGMLDADQSQQLKVAGLDYYNHNLDTSPEFYGNIITTRTYQDRLETLENVRNAGVNVCCGGIVGMGEARADRVAMLQQLANLSEHPESVPINMLVQVEGTPLAGQDELDPIEFVRSVAVSRVLMPQSVVRLSAGREVMSDEMQALCFFAGANSIFYGERLLTTDNPSANKDKALFSKLGLHVSVAPPEAARCAEPSAPLAL